MESFCIRKATMDDMETLQRFEQGVIQAERPFDITLRDDPVQYYDLEEMITSSYIEIVVAILNNEIVASGYARIEDSRLYLQHTKHAYLGFMYVVPEHRGKGINQKIINALKDWAATKNITELRLDVYVNNEPAIRAYEKIGFSGLMLQMRVGIPVITTISLK